MTRLLGKHALDVLDQGGVDAAFGEAAALPGGLDLAVLNADEESRATARQAAATPMVAS